MMSAQSSPPQRTSAFPPPASPVPPAAVPVNHQEPEAEPQMPAARAAPAQQPTTLSNPPGPRRVRLTVSRIDPWSVMKLSFLLSIAFGIVIVVATGLVWSVLNEMEVFAKIHILVEDIGAQRQFGKILEYLEFARVISAATVVAVVDIVLLTALSTLGAFIYNFVAAMVGGLHLTLTDG